MAENVVQRVLLIEDNLADSRLVQELLRDAAADEFEVAAVTDFVSAARALKEQSFDALLLDLGLPDGEGLELVGRALRGAPDSAIIVLTGRDDDGLAEQALRAGAQDYVLKVNMDGAVLTRALRYGLVRRQLEADLGLPLQFTQRLQTLTGATDAILNNLDRYLVELLEGLGNECDAAETEARQRLEALLDLGVRVKVLTDEFGLNRLRDTEE